jgi:hypothetical protein
MACHFNISGRFPLKAGVPLADVNQASRETQDTWTLDQYAFGIDSASPRLVRFCFGGQISAAFADEIVKTVQAWARRFADWSNDVLRYSITFEGQRRHAFYGPDNRCIEAKLSSIEKQLADLQEEWSDLNFTQLAKAKGECSELVDRTEC